MLKNIGWRADKGLNYDNAMVMKRAVRVQKSEMKSSVEQNRNPYNKSEPLSLLTMGVGVGVGVKILPYIIRQ